MKIKYLLLGWTFLLIASHCIAQEASQSILTYTVSGTLLDSLTLEGEPYATIRIHKKDLPEKAVKMAITGVNGEFSEKISTSSGEYVITITSVGKDPVIRDFVVNENSKTIDFGQLFIKESTELLQGVEIVAQKPLVKVDIDKIEYNIEDDPDAQSSNVLEMLRKVPLVTVDGEDNIQVNGSSSFKIHVNGKPNNMMSNNPKDVLKSVPANTIKYIEVITEPGAKYDAEGVGGILNIVTIGGGMEGYTATFNTQVNNYGVRAGGYATVQVGKFTVTGNYTYGISNNPESNYDNYRESYTSDDYKYLYTTGGNKFKNNFQYGNIEGSYEIDTLRLLTFSANMYGGNNNAKNGNSLTEMYNINHELMYRYRGENDYKSRYGYWGVNMDYQRSFKKKGELLTFSYRLNDNPNRNESQVAYYDIIDYPYSLDDLYSKNKAYTVEHTFQADYTNPITDMHEIETGGKYIIRNSRSNSHYYYEDDSQELAEQLDRNNKYDHLQDILAVYAGYRLKYKKFGLKTGLRYEHTFMEIKYHTREESDFNAGFDDLVPSATLSYQLGQTQTLRASYNMRISRPGIWYLNPYVDRTNPDNISYGNPDLESEKSHSFGLTFNSFTPKFNVNLGLRHRFVNNSIERYSWEGTDEETGRENVTHSTYRNFGKYNNTRLDIYFNWNLATATRLYLNGGINYADYQSKQDDTSNNGFVSNGNLGFQHTLPWKLRLSINLGGSTPNITSQGKRSGYYYYGINLNRLFLKERLTVSINTNNIFNEYRTFKSTVYSDNFKSITRQKYPSRYFGVGVSYRIGELKASVKKAARSIQNDDVKSGGSNNEGSGQN